MRGDGHDKHQLVEVRIGCEDLAGRPEELIAIDHSVGLVLVFPPRAWAAFSIRQVEQLRAVLIPPTASRR